jgi:hypothetical protein
MNIYKNTISSGLHFRTALYSGPDVAFPPSIFAIFNLFAGKVG